MTRTTSEPFLDDIPFMTASHKERVDVEVFLHGETDLQYKVSDTETSRPFMVPRDGIKITKRRGPYATFHLTEKRAVDYNLL